MVERMVAIETGSDGLPVLFTLMHPLDDFCPVTFRRPTASELATAVFVPKPPHLSCLYSGPGYDSNRVLH